MTTTREDTLRRIAAEVGLDVDGPIRIGGNYTPVTVHAGTAYVSGQVPRVGEAMVSVGRVGADASLAQAQAGARIGVLRALIQLGPAVGGLAGVAQVLRMGVYVQSAPDFTQQSEVADAASEILVQVFGPQAGQHTRTSVGVYQLPKNATVEVELVVGLADRAA
jgi:enamine deaminase RidA (YjgF/YER057c/UK114 family)